MTEHHIFIFMLQAVIVLGLARVMGEVFRHYKQPPLAGEILAGVVLGQTVFGQLSPELFGMLFPADEIQRAMFGVTAEIGILFLLLVVGLEVNVASAWQMRQRTFTVALAGVVIPLAVGTVAAWLLYDQWVEVPTSRLAFSLLVGAGVAITAITVVARLLFDLKIIKSDLGLFLVSAMALNELLGWVVLAVVLGLVGAGSGTGSEGIDIVALLGPIGGILAFAGFAMTAGRSLTTRALQWIEAKRLPSPATPLSFVVCVGLAGGVVTSALGVHPVFGFLLAGVMAGDPNALSEHTHSIIAQMVESIFVPLFFAGICLSVDFVTHFDLTMVALVTTISIGGKFLGAWIGTVLAKVPKSEQVPVGLAHVPGGPMGVLLASVAKEAGVIGPKMFVALVFASIVSALLVGPAFTWALRRRQAVEPTGMARFFGVDRILTPLDAATPTEAIEALSTHAGALAGTPAATTIRDLAVAREAAMSTGVGEGIAIPHARLDDLEEPMVLLGVCRDPIAWNAIDGKDVQLVFLVLTPTQDNNAQLEILATIATALHDDLARASVIEAGTPADTWRALRAVLPAGPAGSRPRGNAASRAR